MKLDIQKTKMYIASVCKFCKLKCKIRLSYGDMVHCPNFKSKDSEKEDS